MRHSSGKTARNREYDPFAAIYNRYWGAEYRRAVLPVMEGLLLSTVPGSSSILDICCGTGQITAEIGGRGYPIEGLDSSGAMIRFARRNAPGVRFTLADVRDFSLGRKFGAAYCVYESLNHLPTSADLLRAFRHIRRHLRRGAPFLFDLLREEAYILYWNNTDAMVEGDSAWITQSTFDEESKRGTCRVTTFERADHLWKRKDFTLRQTCHPIDQAQQALARAGFGDVALYDAADAGMSKDTGYGRTFFLARA